MILIVESVSNSCDWTVIDYANKEVLKTRTGCLNLGKLDIFKICNILHAIRGLFELKEEIKTLLVFYGEESIGENHKSNLLLVFKDYFPNAKIRIEKSRL